MPIRSERRQHATEEALEVACYPVVDVGSDQLEPSRRCRIALSASSTNSVVLDLAHQKPNGSVSIARVRVGVVGGPRGRTSAQTARRVDRVHRDLNWPGEGVQMRERGQQSVGENAWSSRRPCGHTGEADGSLQEFRERSWITAQEVTIDFEYRSCGWRLLLDRLTGVGSVPRVIPVTSRRAVVAARRDQEQPQADAVCPSAAVDHLRAEFRSALEAARRQSAMTADSRIAGPAANAAQLLAEALESSAAPHTPTSRLTVALMGRTKAGKSQLVAALTNDREGAGVGLGRHRTTTVERSTALDGFDLIDLPGVGALDGEDDTSLAVSVAARADAVLWLYAESLQDTEATELEDLLRQGKPVVVAFNAKWSVNPEPRRRVFVKSPDLAFRDLETHQERIRQIAARAGTQTPQFVAVHARAAWFAMLADDPELRKASRVDDLLAECESALTARAEVLRIRSRHDRPRRHLVELGSAARLVADEIGDGQGHLAELLTKEAAALSRALAQVHSDAHVRVDAAVADSRKGLRRWVKKHRDSDEARLNASWNDYVRRAGYVRVLERYEADVGAEIVRSRTILQSAESVGRKLFSSKGLSASPDRGLWGRVKSGLRALRRAATSSLRALGIDRGVAMLFAKIGGRAVPGVGWWLLGVDALQGLSAGAREELADRRLRLDRWSEDQALACESDLAEAERTVRSRLVNADRATRDEVAQRLDTAKRALGAAAELRDQLLSAAEISTAGVRNCDRELVNELLQYGGCAPDVVAVVRSPNEKLSVTFRGRGDHRPALALLSDLLAPELVSERTGMLGRRKRQGPRRKGKR